MLAGQVKVAQAMAGVRVVSGQSLDRDVETELRLRQLIVSAVFAYILSVVYTDVLHALAMLCIASGLS